MCPLDLVYAFSCCSCAGGYFWGCPTAPGTVPGWLAASLIILRQEGFKKVAPVLGRGRRQELVLWPGGPLCTHSPCRLSKLSSPVSICSRQALAQQLSSAPWIPDEGKIIAASSYNQLATGGSHWGEFVYILHTLHLRELSALRNGRLGWSSAYQSQSWK